MAITMSRLPPEVAGSFTAGRVGETGAAGVDGVAVAGGWWRHGPQWPVEQIDHQTVSILLVGRRLKLFGETGACRSTTTRSVLASC